MFLCYFRAVEMLYSSLLFCVKLPIYGFNFIFIKELPDEENKIQTNIRKESLRTQNDI